MDARRLLDLLSEEAAGAPERAVGTSSRAEEIANLLPRIAANARQRLLLLRLFRDQLSVDGGRDVIELLIANLSDEISTLARKSAGMAEARRNIGFAQGATLAAALGNVAITITGGAGTAVATLGAPVAALLMGCLFAIATVVRLRSARQSAVLDSCREGYDDLRAALRALLNAL